ncbi:MAG: hypothetical protein MUE47_00325 [Acidobacteria bacterium]|jgi:hypothetical protein|nr:hypothetical protein [Acidobacteriota bacterium]
MSTQAALAATLLHLAAGATAEPPCPAVYQVAGSKDPSISYNILFLGAGFETDELPAFQRVAQELASKVLERPSFAPYRGWINCYRMDLVSKNDVDVERCSSYCKQRTPLATEIEKPVARGTLVEEGVEDVTTDLVARRCWASPDSKRKHGNCHLLWLDADDRDKVLRLRSCAPNIHAVVVVANLQEPVGGGLKDALAAGIGLIVMGSSPGGEDSDTLANDFAVALLEHEFGHLFGLSDEYAESTRPPRGDYHADGGVLRWKLEASEFTQSQSLPANEPSASADCAAQTLPINREPTSSIQWRAAQGTSCKHIDECHGSTEFEDGRCDRSPGSRELCAHCEIAGLRAGAHDSRAWSQRVANSCLMKVVLPDERPCEACRRQIHRALCKEIPQAPACTGLQAPSAAEQSAEKGSANR